MKRQANRLRAEQVTMEQLRFKYGGRIAYYIETLAIGATLAIARDCLLGFAEYADDEYMKAAEITAPVRDAPGAVGINCVVDDTQTPVSSSPFPTLQLPVPSSSSSSSCISSASAYATPPVSGQ